METGHALALIVHTHMPNGYIVGFFSALSIYHKL